MICEKNIFWPSLHNHLTIWYGYKLWASPDIVSVLGREEGYTVKYGLSPKNPNGSGLILPYIPA